MSNNPMNGNINPIRGFQSMIENQLKSNPLYQRAQEMAKNKSPEEIQQICQNLCQQRGIDINQAINQFKNQFNIK